MTPAVLRVADSKRRSRLSCLALARQFSYEGIVMRKLFLKGVAAGFVAIALFATPAVAQDVGGAENGGTTSGGATTRAEDDGFDPGWIGLAGLLGLLGLM